MRPFSPPPSLSLSLARSFLGSPLFELAAEDLFPATIPSARPRPSALVRRFDRCVIQVETPSVRPSLLSKNDYGIEMKIRSGIHPSPFLFGPRFCTITSHFLSSLQHQSFIVSFNIVHLIPTYPSIALEKLK